MTKDFATEVYLEKEKLRELIADETIHWWKKNGVLSFTVDYYKAKEKLMDCLSDIGA